MRKLTRILVQPRIVRMAWRVELKESVIDDLRWFGKRDGRLLLREALRRLEAGPIGRNGQDEDIAAELDGRARAATFRQVPRAVQRR